VINAIIVAQFQCRVSSAGNKAGKGLKNQCLAHILLTFQQDIRTKPLLFLQMSFSDLRPYLALSLLKNEFLFVLLGRNAIEQLMTLLPFH
jgi:hypothetical protein